MKRKRKNKQIEKHVFYLLVFISPNMLLCVSMLIFSATTFREAYRTHADNGAHFIS